MKLYTRLAEQYRTASVLKKGLIAVTAALGLTLGSLMAIILAAVMFLPDTPRRAAKAEAAGTAPATAAETAAAATAAAQNDEQNRRDAVKAGITEGRSVAADKKRCDTAKDILTAWDNLKQVKASDAEWLNAQKVARGLEACRLKTERTLSEGMRSIMIMQREQWAKTTERKLLDAGMEVEVSLLGPNKEFANMKWVLMSKLAAHQMTDGGSMTEGKFLAGLQKIGFRAVIFANGRGGQWTYGLAPTDETNGGAKVLDDMGLGQPLVLQ